MMKRRLLSLLLCVALMATMLPTTAWAESEGVDGVCPHHTAHTEACGYAEGGACGYLCKVCPVQALIDALPEDATAETKAEAQSALDAVDAARAALTEEEAAQLNLARYTALSGKLAALEPPAPEVKIISAWAWNDELDALDEETGNLALSGASEETPVTFADVAAFLPTSITAQVDGESVTLNLGGWTCGGYPEAGAFEGEYTFTATLPEGYALGEGVQALRIGVLLGGATMLTVDGVTYIDANGAQRSASNVTVLEGMPEDLTLNSGWYLLRGTWTAGEPLTDPLFGENTLRAVTVSGDVHLILANNCNVTIIGRINVPEGNSLSIYSQSNAVWNGDGTPAAGNAAGRLTLSLESCLGYVACIGGGGSPGNCGSVTINGGFITALGSFCTPIGGASTTGSAGNITINGGSVRADCDGLTPAIGGSGGSVTINGGYVVASGELYDASEDKTVLYTGIDNCSFAAGDNAVVFAGNITDQTGKSGWKGIVFVRDENGALVGQVYGSPTLEGNLTIPAGATLTIPTGSTLTVPEGVTLDVQGTLVNNGTLVANGTVLGAVTGNAAKYSFTYLDTDGTTKTALCENNGTTLPTTLESGWYAVKGNVTVDGRITVNGNVRLILTDGGTLNANQGIRVTDNDSDITNGSIYGLTVYAQSAGDAAGRLVAQSSGGAAAIGGENGKNSGRVIINGGNISAVSSDGGAGIGGGQGSMGFVVVNGGNVSAKGSAGSAGIGNGGVLTINGGTVTAEGGSGSSGTGAGVGGSATGSGGFIVIEGGSVNAGKSGAQFAIGAGSNGTSGIVFNKSATATIAQSQSMAIPFTIAAGRRLVIAEGATLTLAGGGTTIINGSMEVGGALIVNTGVLKSNGTTYVDGTLTVTGTNTASGNIYFPLTLTDATSNQTVTYSGKTYARKGYTITLKPNPPAGQALGGWEVTPDGAVTISDSCTFTMPGSAVSIRARYEKAAASVTIDGAEKLYATLDEAVANTKYKKATIKLLDNVTTDACMNIMGDDIKLDLNGYTWSAATAAFSVSNGPLTLCDTSAAQSGKLVSKGANEIRSKLFIEGGTFDGTVDDSGLFAPQTGSQITITGGKFLQPVIMDCSVDFTWSVSGDPTFRDFRIGGVFAKPSYCEKGISGGTFESIRTAIRNADGTPLQDWSLDYYKFHVQRYLVDCCGFYAADGSLMGDKAIKLTNVTVGVAHNLTYTITSTQHTATCTNGDYTKTEKHSYGANGLCVCGAASVRYLDADGTLRGPVFCMPAAQSMTGGWYVVSSDMTFDERVTITGDVHLILADGFTLTANQGIQVHDDDTNITNGSANRLTVYAQSTNAATMGALIAQNNGIGSIETTNCGVITINGGKVTAARSGDGSAAALGGAGANVTINGGIVTATGSGYGPGIGEGYVTINGGTVYAKGGHSFNNYDAADIGASVYGSSGLIIINGGTVSRDPSGTPCTIGAGDNGESGIVFNRSKTATITESQYLQIPCTIEAGRTLVVPEGVKLGVAPNVTLTVDGVMEVNGTFEIWEGGELNGSGRVYLDGSLTGNYTGSNVYSRLKLENASVASGSTATYKGKLYARAGSTVGLNTVIPAGQAFVRWETDPASVTVSAENRVVMPMQAVTVKAVCEDIVANVTIDGKTTSYATMEEAFAAASGKKAKIVLVRNATAGLGQVLSGGEITFDGGVYTLTFSNPDSSVTTPGLYIDNDCIFTMVGGTLRSNNGTVLHLSARDVKLAGGTIDGNFPETYIGLPESKSAVRLFTGTLTVSGDTRITSTSDGIVTENYSIFTMTGGEVIAKGYALKIGKNGSAKLSGGTFVSDYDFTVAWELNMTGIGGIGVTIHCLSEALADDHVYYSTKSGWMGKNPETKSFLLAGTVYVLPQPAIATQPVDTTLTYGQDKSLTFAANGKGYQYQWYKVTDSAEEAVSGATNGTLPLSALDAGTYRFYCKATLGDVTLTSNTVTVTVNVGTPTLAVKSGLTAQYSGAAYSGTPFTVTAGLESKVKVTYRKDGVATTPVGVGTYTVEVELPATANYQRQTATGTLTIAPRTVTVSGITAKDKTYDGKRNAELDFGSAVFAGKLAGDELTVTAAGEFAGEAVGSGKTVTISSLTLGGADAGNYKLAASGNQSAAKASISAKQLTVEVSVKDKPYDGKNTAEFAANPTLQGVIDGDDVSLTGGTPTFTSVAAGENIPITFTTFTLTGDDAGNYAFKQPSGVTASIYIPFTPAKDTDYTVNSNDWLNTDFTVTAASGRELSLTGAADGTWKEQLTVSTDGQGSLTFYVRDKQTGAISLAATEAYKVDKTAPSPCDVTYQAISVKKALGSEAFSLFFGKDVAVKITAADGLSGIKSVEYFRSETALTAQKVAALTGWTAGDSLTIPAVDKQKFVLYVRVTDNAGNVTLFAAEGAEFDLTPPAITGVTGGETCYTTRLVSVSDDHLDAVTLNGAAASTEITLTGNTTQTYAIVATDKAGNRTAVTVSMKPIAELSKPIDALNAGNVNSGHAQTIEAVKKAAAAQDVTNATDAEKEALKAIADKVEKLNKAIDDTQKELQRLDTGLGDYEESSVNSDDADALKKLAQDIQKLLDADNLTDAERKKLRDAKEKAEKLTKTIDDTQKEIQRLDTGLGGYEESSVNSDDADALKKLAEDIQKLLDADNLTDAERQVLNEAKEEAERLIQKVEKAAEAANTDSVKEVEDITADNVRPADKSALQEAKADLEKALEEYGDNYTDEEKQAIQEAIQRIDDALMAIARMEATYYPDYGPSDEPDAPEESGSQTGDDMKSPLTGDSAAPWLLVALMLAAVWVAAHSLRRKTAE